MAVIYFLAIGLTIAFLIMVAVRVFEGWKAVRDWKSRTPEKGEEGQEDRQDQKRPDHGYEGLRPNSFPTPLA